MKAAFVLDAIYSKQAESQITGCIRESIKGAVKGVGSFKQSRDQERRHGFWETYFGDDALVKASRLFFVSFYWSGTTAEQVESRSGYEVLISYRDQVPPYLTYYIVRSGGLVGDKVIYLKHSLAIPEPELKPQTGYNLIDTSPFDRWVMSVTYYIGKKLDGNLLNSNSLNFEYGVTTLENEPLVKLPLLNIPLQCAFEMASRAVGPRTLEEAWENRRKGEESSQADLIKGNPENETLFCALLQYSLWRRLNLTDKEQLEGLRIGMQHANMTCIYSDGSAIALRNRLNGIFAKHLEQR